jgi:hypothetical protein
MHWEASGATLGAVIAIHDGRLDSISAIYLNDDLVTLSGFGWVQEGADGRYGTGDLVQIKTRLGIPTETHYSEMTSKFSATWPTTCRGDGVASLMMLATHRSRESFPKHFPNGEPIPSIVGQAVCYDWRADSTAGGSGSQRRNDQSTWGPSGNPIVWLVHHEWHRLGRSWDRCIAPVLADLTAEANYCDASVAKVGGTEARYQFGGNCPTNLEPQSRRDAMLASCDGWMSTNAKGYLVIKAGRYVAPTLTITGDHITAYDWSSLEAEESRVNKLVVSYLDASRDYTETEADPWFDTTDIAAGGFERPENLQLLWVQSRSQARRLAKRKMSRLASLRRGQIVTGLYGLNAFGHRYIRIQNAELASMADVVVEVMGVEFDPMSATVVIDVILADINIDAWNPATEEGSAVSGSDRPAPEALAAPGITAATAFFEATGSGTGVRLNVVGTGPDRGDLTWYVRWRVQGATAWVEGQFADSDGTSGVELETGFVPADETLEVQIAYETGGGTLSAWGPTTPATVDTSTPPGATVSLNFLTSQFLNGVASANSIGALEGWSFTRAGSAYGTASAGGLTSFATDTARVTDQGLLIEAAATNVSDESQTIDAAGWVATGTVTKTANHAVAPDGTTTADRVELGAGASYIGNSTATGLTNGQPCTLSFWAKGVSAGQAIGVRSGVTGTNSTRTLTTAWQRFTWTFNAGGTSEVVQFADGDLVSGAAATCDFHLWGVQLENGSTASSYIPTVAAAVTRPAEVASLTIPAGGATDSIVVTWSGGSQTFARSTLASPTVLNLGASSSGNWVGRYIQTVTVTPV